MRNRKKRPNKREPERLAHGKRIHRKIQDNWHQTAQGKVKDEEEIVKLGGRKGRIDIFVDANDEDDKDLVAVVEIKASDWDSMTLSAVRRNVGRYANQIWSYIESQLEKGKDVSVGIIFPERPKNPKRLKLIERLFDERGIPVVWEDETIKERKARS